MRVVSFERGVRALNSANFLDRACKAARETSTSSCQCHRGSIQDLRIDASRSTFAAFARLDVARIEKDERDESKRRVGRSTELA